MIWVIRHQHCCQISHVTIPFSVNASRRKDASQNLEMRNTSNVLLPRGTHLEHVEMCASIVYRTVSHYATLSLTWTALIFHAFCPCMSICRTRFTRFMQPHRPNRLHKHKTSNVQLRSPCKALAINIQSRVHVKVCRKVKVSHSWLRSHSKNLQPYFHMSSPPAKCNRKGSVALYI